MQLFPKNNPPLKPKKHSYQIQVGAFSVKDNAEQLKSMLKTQDVVSEIVERNINGSTLFCVWIKASDNFDETLRYATKIQRKYNLQYRIIKE
jgi:cell division protein FtsN